MTKEEMINAYYTNGNGERNYEDARKIIKEAMASGKQYGNLGGKHSSGEFTG